MKRVVIPSVVVGAIVAAFAAGARDAVGQYHTPVCFLPQMPGWGCPGCSQTFACTPCESGTCQGTYKQCGVLRTFILARRGKSIASLVERPCFVVYPCGPASPGELCNDVNLCIKDRSAPQASSSMYWTYEFDGNCAMPEVIESDPAQPQFYDPSTPLDFQPRPNPPTMPPVRPPPVWRPPFYI